MWSGSVGDGVETGLTGAGDKVLGAALREMQDTVDLADVYFSERLDDADFDTYAAAAKAASMPAVWSE